MTEQEYRSHPAVSRSDLWLFSESPQKFRYAKDNPQEPTPALLFGQVFHKLALEPDTFDTEFSVAPVVDRRTSSGKKEWQDFIEASSGKTVISAEMLEQASAMVNSINTVPLAVKLLDGVHEIPFFWTDAITGEPCKCRADCLNTKYSQPIIVDLKSASDASTETFSKDAVKYGYDLQSAMYSDGVEANIRRKPLFVFIVVEKNPPYAVNILQADDLFIQRGKILFQDFINEYHYCKQSGNWYGYMGRTCQINNLSLPAWLAKELT